MKREDKKRSAAMRNDLDALNGSQGLPDLPERSVAMRNDLDALNGSQGLPGDNLCINQKYLKNRIIECIKQYEIEFNVNVSEIKQIQWNSVLEYIGENVIKTLNIDIRNIDIMNSICTIYLSICRMCLKTSSIYGYSLISCIPYSTLLSYKNGNTYSVYIDIDNDYTEIESKSINVYRMHHKNNRILELSNTYYSGMIKRISADREHGLTDKTEDGSIPSLALGKIEFGWIESAKEKLQVEIAQKYTLPQDILKEYSENN